MNYIVVASVSQGCLVGVSLSLHYQHRKAIPQLHNDGYLSVFTLPSIPTQVIDGYICTCYSAKYVSPSMADNMFCCSLHLCLHKNQVQ